MLPSCSISRATIALMSVVLILVAGCASSESSIEDGDAERSFDSVTSEQIAESPSSSLSEILKGKVAGVDVYEHSGGISVRIRGTTSIRGSNEPLYIVDGFPTAAGPGGVLHINPYDIERIEVLKGHEAALYGVRGSNGVIVVTTKRGSKR